MSQSGQGEASSSAMQVDINLARWDPFSKIYESFICSICLEDFTDVHMTECGHNFCEACIRESLDRRHYCPLCQRETTADQLRKNHTMDALLHQIKEQKEQLIQNYVQEQVRAAAYRNGIGDTQGNRELSPIEALFQKHTKRGLMEFEIYMQQLRGQYEARQSELSVRYQDRLSTLQARRHVEFKMLVDQDQNSVAGGNSLSEPGSSPALMRSQSVENAREAAEALKSNYQKESTELKTWFDRAEESLLAAYDQHMAAVIPSPHLLPIKCSLVVHPALDQMLPLRCEATLKPTDTVSTVLQILKQKIADVIGFGEGVKIALRRAPGQMEMVQGCALISELGVRAGAEFVVSGNVQLHSVEPPKCLTAVWETEAQKLQDYFRCKTCNLNWVCKACSEYCHKDHEVCVFMKDHKPSFACCYCMQKRKCKIQNSRNQGK
eukprot:g58457.t1